MYQNPTFPRAAGLSREKRFPYALAAAILAVVLVGGLLITARFGFDNQGDKNFGGASFPRQNETIITSATPTASMTPSPLNPIAVTAIPTILPNSVNPAGITSTPIPFDGSMVSPTIPYVPTMPTTEAVVLCEGRTIAVTVSEILPLMSRPNAVVVGSIPGGEPVQILDIATTTDTLNAPDPATTANVTTWYFVRPSVSGFAVQGWLPSYRVTLTTSCPSDVAFVPPFDPISGTSIVMGGTVEPLDPTTSAVLNATAEAHYGDLGTASAQSQVDSDGDGLTDNDESLLGTNPKAWDTDGDGWGDGSEIRSGTNPLNIDTDMDGEVDSQDRFPTEPNQREATIAALLHTATAQAYTPTPTVTPSATFSATPAFSPTPPVCSPLTPSRLSVGDQGRVIGEGRTGVNLRGNYGFDAPLIRLLDAGTEFEVLDEYTICDAASSNWGTQWFQIAIDGEEAGWIPETMWVINDGAASNVYVIEPLD